VRNSSYSRYLRTRRRRPASAFKSASSPSAQVSPDSLLATTLSFPPVELPIPPRPAAPSTQAQPVSSLAVACSFPPVEFRIEPTPTLQQIQDKAIADGVRFVAELIVRYPRQVAAFGIGFFIAMLLDNSGRRRL
jgi:hypothetical protein